MQNNSKEVADNLVFLNTSTHGLFTTVTEVNQAVQIRIKPAPKISQIIKNIFKTDRSSVIDLNKITDLEKINEQNQILMKLFLSKNHTIAKLHYLLQVKS